MLYFLATTIYIVSLTQSKNLKLSQSSLKNQIHYPLLTIWTSSKVWKLTVHATHPFQIHFVFLLEFRWLCEAKAHRLILCSTISAIWTFKTHSSFAEIISCNEIRLDHYLPHSITVVRGNSRRIYAKSCRIK